tara:strand:+ start:141 stop:476 length:336 start_codon:yes stop_codon:yes gene_type:complete
MEKIRDILQKEINPMNLSDKEKGWVLDRCLFHKRYIQEVESVNSGGGCWHLLLHLKNKHIINITDLREEYSYDKFEDISDYFDHEDKGFGWEYLRPNYYMRCSQIAHPTYA